MEKADIKRQLKALYDAPAGQFVVVDVPELTYFMIDGTGDPNVAAAYKSAVEALYAAAYTLKFASKVGLKRDYVVPPLEGLWWSDDMSDFLTRNKAGWSWRMMTLVPDFVGPTMARDAIAATAKKKSLPALAALRVDRLAEGRVVQTLHIGSHDDEGPVLHRLHDEFLPAQGLVPTGLHHEIYLSDPRRVPAAKLKTILRQPVREIADVG